MNYTNKDFLSRIGQICDLNLTSIQNDVGQSQPERNGPCLAETSRQNRPFSELAGPSHTMQLRGIDSSRNTIDGENKLNLDLGDSYVIVAIAEGREHAQGEVGIAAFDITFPSLVVMQICDAFWYRDVLLKISVLNASEVIFPTTSQNQSSKLLDEIQKNFPGIKATPVPRRHFGDENILKQLSTICTVDSKIVLNTLQTKYYAIMAVTGLLKYLKECKFFNFAANSLKIDYQKRESRMFIDYDTYHRLELQYTLTETKETRCSLYGLLNYTVTSVGGRCLRAHIMEPFSKLENINDLQDSIKEFLANPDLLRKAQECLKHFNQCDQLLKICILPPQSDAIKSVEIMLNRVLLLKKILSYLQEFRNILKQIRSKLVCKLMKNLSDTRLGKMAKTIEEYVDPDITFIRGTGNYFQRIHAIRSGFCEFLDFLRNIYNNLTTEIKNKVIELAERFNLPLRLAYSVKNGFHMELTSTVKNPINAVPSQLDVIFQRGKTYHVTCSELHRLNTRMIDLIEELHKASYIATKELIEKLMVDADATYILTGVVSSLDIILSLAKASSKPGYCCPEFGYETRITGGIHPFLEYTVGGPEPIPNNIIGTSELNFFIITGPNMGGKTLYIKQIAVLQIMAQLGCYVPANEASFRLSDRIFTRIGQEDGVEKSMSSHVAEMKEFEYILKNITPNSLVIIDEICRNTNPKEGQEIAFKLCKKFASIYGKNNFYYHRCNNQTATCDSNSTSTSKHNISSLDLTSPFIYVTTHFLELTKLADTFFNISNLYLDAEEYLLDGKLHLKFHHTVKHGVTPTIGYGLALARTVNFPGQILQRAEEIHQQLLAKEKNLNQSERTTSNNTIEILKNLEKSTLNAAFRSSDNSIRNFMNKSHQPDQWMKSANDVNNQTVISDQHKQSLRGEFYEIFSSIASAVRNDSPNFQIECSNVLDNYIAKCPSELLSAMNELDSLRSLIGSAETTTQTSNPAKIAGNDRINFADMSRHSLLKFFNPHGSKSGSETKYPSTSSQCRNAANVVRSNSAKSVQPYHYNFQSLPTFGGPYSVNNPRISSSFPRLVSKIAANLLPSSTQTSSKQTRNNSKETSRTVDGSRTNATFTIKNQSTSKENHQK